MRALAKVASSSLSEPSFCNWTPIELNVENTDEAPLVWESSECSWFWMPVVVLSPWSSAACLVVGS